MSTETADIIESLNAHMLTWMNVLPEKNMAHKIESIAEMLIERETWTTPYDTEHLDVALRLKELCAQESFEKALSDKPLMGSVEANVMYVLAHLSPVARLTFIMNLLCDNPSQLSNIIRKRPTEDIKAHYHNVTMTLAILFRETFRMSLVDEDRVGRVQETVKSTEDVS